MLATYETTTCPIVHHFTEQQKPEYREIVKQITDDCAPGDSIVTLKRIHYLLEVTTGMVMIAGAGSGKAASVTHTLVGMKRAIAAIKGAPPACYTQNDAMLIALSRQTGELFAVCIGLIESAGTESVRDLVVDIIQTVVAIK